MRAVLIAVMVVNQWPFLRTGLPRLFHFKTHPLPVLSEECGMYGHFHCKRITCTEYRNKPPLLPFLSRKDPLCFDAVP